MPTKSKPPSRASLFADRIEALGYTVQRKKISSHEKQVLATFKDVTIIATWVDDKFISPVDFVQGTVTTTIRKTKEALEYAETLVQTFVDLARDRAKSEVKSATKPATTTPKRRGRPPKAPTAPEPVVSRSSDEPPETDEEYIAKVRGATILWTLVGKERKTKIPKDAKHLKIDYSGSIGRRCLTFCDDDGFHTRPLSEIRII